MALIEAEYTGRFRAVFAFGPIEEADGYDPPTLGQPGDPDRGTPDAHRIEAGQRVGTWVRRS